MNDLPWLTAAEIAAAYAARRLSPVELVRALLARIETYDPQVNANAGKGGAPYGTVQPSAAELAKATAAALANARTNAEALAAASGRKLGALRSISSQMPGMGCCPPNSGWMVQLTVTFEWA